MLGDRAYDAEHIRRGLRARHILPLLAMRNTEHGSGLGRWRWVVERTFAWLSQFRRLRVRYERRSDMHVAFLTLGCIMICWKFLQAQRPQLSGFGRDVDCNRGGRIVSEPDERRRPRARKTNRAW